MPLTPRWFVVAANTVAAMVVTATLVSEAHGFEPYAPERVDEPTTYYVDDSELEDQHFVPLAERGFAMQLMAGPGYRNAYGVHFITADIELAIGAQTRVGGIYGRLLVGAGKTAHGLDVITPMIGFAWEIPLGPFRIGPGFQLGVLGYIRQTTNNYDGAFGIGPHLHAHWDFVKGERLAGFLGLRSGGEYYFTDRTGPFVPNVALQLGIRFFGANR